MAAKSAEEDIELTLKVIMASITDDGAGVDDSDDDTTDSAPDAPAMIVDVPTSPVAPEPVAAAAAVFAPKKKGGNPHKEGVLSPIVVAAGAVLGDKMLNEIRGTRPTRSSGRPSCGRSSTSSTWTSPDTSTRRRWPRR